MSGAVVMVTRRPRRADEAYSTCPASSRCHRSIFYRFMVVASRLAARTGGWQCRSALLPDAMLIKRLAGQINVTIHALGMPMPFEPARSRKTMPHQQEASFGGVT